MLFTPAIPLWCPGKLGSRRGQVVRGGHSLSETVPPRRKRRVDLTGSECGTEPFLSEEERNRRHSSAQNQEGGSWQQRGGSRQEGSSYRLGAHGVELSDPRRFPRLGPRSPSRGRGSSLPSRPCSQCCSIMPPQTGPHWPADPAVFPAGAPEPSRPSLKPASAATSIAPTLPHP